MTGPAYSHLTFSSLSSLSHFREVTCARYSLFALRTYIRVRRALMRPGIHTLFGQEGLPRKIALKLLYIIIYNNSNPAYYIRKNFVVAFFSIKASKMYFYRSVGGTSPELSVISRVVKHVHPLLLLECPEMRIFNFSRSLILPQRFDWPLHYAGLAVQGDFTILAINEDLAK